MIQYTRQRYPDGSVYAEFDDLNRVSRDRPVKICERINTYEDLFFIKSIKDVLNYNGIHNVELTIPCMFQQQHDRRFDPLQSFELQLVCDFINSCNFTKVKVFHPHSDSTQMGLYNCEIIDNSQFINDILTYHLFTSIPILLSTDAGSFKWINKLATKLKYPGEVYAASKCRDLTTSKLIQVIDRQDFEGKDILVLDDLCVYGGTFIGIAEMLKTRNIGKLYLAVSHMTVQNPNKALETAYDRVFCTNSKYNSYDLSNLTVIPYFK